MTTLLLLCGGVCVWSVTRTLTAMRRDPHGPEAEAQRNSLWLIAGSGVALLGLVGGPIGLRVGLLATSAGLTARGAWLGRQLRARRQRELIHAGERATTTIDRVDSLEGRRQLLPYTPLRYRAVIIGFKLITVVSSLSFAVSTSSPRGRILFGVPAAGFLLWIVGDLVVFRRQSLARARMDLSIDSALSRLPAGEVRGEP